MKKSPIREQMEIMLEHAGIDVPKFFGELKSVFRIRYGSINYKEANQFISRITMTTQTQTNPSDADILSSAQEILKANGSVTTLEIKENLRQNGFWVDQLTVSDAMDRLHTSKGWEWTFDNGHRLYSYASAQVKQMPVKKGRKPSVFINFVDVTNAPVADIKQSQANSQDNWLVWDKAEKNKVHIYGASETRDHVRSHYARVCGCKIQDVRARRLKKTTLAS